jgi:hypothetical protein
MKTPRVDALLHSALPISENDVWELARQLEREVAALKAEYAELSKLVTSQGIRLMDAEEAEAERDALKAELEGMANRNRAAQNTLKAERDALLKLVEGLGLEGKVTVWANDTTRKKL